MHVEYFDNKEKCTLTDYVPPPSRPTSYSLSLSLSLSLELSGLGKQERNCALSIFYNPKAKCEVWSVKYTQRAQHFSAFESFSASLTHVSSDRNILLEVGLGNALMPHSLNTTR